MSWDIFSKSKIQYFLQKLKDKFVQKETGKGLSTNDYTTTDKNKVSKIDETTTSISGNPISISGLKSNQLAINPIITFEPIQAGSGTPSPSNIRAISGYDKIEVLSCGKNIWDGKYSEENKFLNADGTLTSTNGWYVTSYVPVKANTSYTVSYTGNGLSGSSMCWYNSAKEFIASKTWSSVKEETISMPSNAKYLRVSYHSSTYNFQIEENNIKTTYEAPNKTTDLSESLGQTVYGATWYLRTGELSNTHKAVDMGNLSWTYYSSSTRPFFYTILSDASGNATPNNSWCEIYPIVTDVFDKSMYWNGTQIRVFDYSYTDATAFTNAVSGKKLVYPLATPFEIQLTPHEISLLKDYAYVSTNGTSIALDYHNGEMASLADVSQLGETVNELGKYINIEHNEFDTAVDISSATASSRYTFPSDGYIFINGRNNTSGYIRAYAYGRQSNAIAAGISVNITGTQQMASLYVRKGMRCYIDTNVTGFNAQFIPLV